MMAVVQHARPAPRPRGSYELLLEHASDALLVIEQGQRSYRVTNAAAVRLLRFTREELLSLGPDDVTDPAESPRLETVRARLADEGWWRGRWGLRRKDGSIVQTDATVARVVVGGRVLLQGLFRERTDESHQHWLEDALREAHEVQHELNNQLAVTTGYAELLNDNSSVPADLREAAHETLVGGLAAVDVGRRLIACFTRD